MKKLVSLVAVILVIALAGVTLAACTLPKSQSKQLIGKWSDANNLSGYEFHEDGTVDITYVNFTIPILNIPFNGTIEGVYTTEKVDDVNYVTLSYTLYVSTESITKKYQYSVDGSSLTLTDPDDGKSSVYVRRAATDTSADTSAAAN